jgi:FAD/FMN-containing dehydrogenase
MTTYEDLVAATLPHGLMPLVVPQLKTITLGGAVTGLGIESSSFRNGLPHESVTRTRHPHRRRSGGHGQAGQRARRALRRVSQLPTARWAIRARLKIELEPVRPFVKLTHVRFDNAEACFEALEKACRGGEHDFVDGTVFGPDELYLTLASFVDEAPLHQRLHGHENLLSVHSGQNRGLPHRARLSVAVGHRLVLVLARVRVQKPVVRALWPRRYRRSDSYHKIIAFDRRHGVSTRLSKVFKKPLEEPVVQDIEVPVSRAAEFLEFFHRDVGITPVWLCPLALRGSKTWPLYPLQPDTLYVNFGFWSSVPLAPGMDPGHHNRLIEAEVAALGGHKSLYSTVHYGRDEFWKLYHGEAYEPVKSAYDPAGRLPDLFAKCTAGK